MMGRAVSDAPQPDALRFMPALNVTRGEIAEMIDGLDAILTKIGAARCVARVQRTPPGRPWSLRPQNRCTGRRASLKVDVRLGRILQRVGVIDWHVQLSVDHGGEQGVGALQQL